MVRRIATLLSAGTLASVAVVALASVLVVASGRTPREVRGPALDPAGLPGELLGLRPDGILWLGLLLIVALPTARVVLALVGYTRARDRDAALTAAGVLAVLALSVALALALR